jgi:hypothetical protein
MAASVISSGQLSPPPTEITAGGHALRPRHRRPRWTEPDNDDPEEDDNLSVSNNQAVDNDTDMLEPDMEAESDDGDEDYKPCGRKPVPTRPKASLSLLSSRPPPVFIFSSDRCSLSAEATTARQRRRSFGLESERRQRPPRTLSSTLSTQRCHGRRKRTAAFFLDHDHYRPRRRRRQ